MRVAGWSSCIWRLRRGACIRFIHAAPPLWRRTKDGRLYRVCRGDKEDLRPVAAPLQAGPLDLRLRVLDAIVDGSSSRSPWLHWTLDKRVADKYREDARLRYGDQHNYVILSLIHI